MELRSGIYKGVHGVLSPSYRRHFEEGVNLLFSSWTALCLAIDNEWGGPTSRQKAEQLYQDVLCWFYGHTEHYADDLEVDLEGFMLQDFNVELQDDSARQVSVTLVSLHQECLQGNLDRIQQLKQHMNLGSHSLANSQQEVVDHDGTLMHAECMDSSGTDCDDPHDVESHLPQGNGCIAKAPAVNVHRRNDVAQHAPVLDADGFQTVCKPSRRHAQHASHHFA